MTNEELKKKIVDILKEAIKPIECGGDREHAPEVHYPTEEEIADALIAAGIGDVSELKKHRVVVEKSLIPEDDNAYVLPNIPPTVKQLYSGEEVEQIVKERDEYKHRAEVAERALNSACFILAKNYYTDGGVDWAKRGAECATFYREQAERELAEEGKDE